MPLFHRKYFIPIWVRMMIRFSKAIFAVLFGLVALERLPAQTNPDNVTTQVTGETAAAEYRLGSGDLISIQIADVDELSNRSFRIDPDGRIDLPLIGKLSV